MELKKAWDRLVHRLLLLVIGLALMLGIGIFLLVSSATSHAGAMVRW